MLQDVVTCAREGCTIDSAGFRRERFADRFLKPPAEMARLFERHPEAGRPYARNCRALPVFASELESIPVSGRRPTG